MASLEVVGLLVQSRPSAGKPRPDARAPAGSAAQRRGLAIAGPRSVRAFALVGGQAQQFRIEGGDGPVQFVDEFCLRQLGQNAAQYLRRIDRRKIEPIERRRGARLPRECRAETVDGLVIVLVLELDAAAAGEAQRDVMISKIAAHGILQHSRFVVRHRAGVLRECFFGVRFAAEKFRGYDRGTPLDQTSGDTQPAQDRRLRLASELDWMGLACINRFLFGLAGCTFSLQFDANVPSRYEKRLMLAGLDAGSIKPGFTA